VIADDSPDMRWLVRTAVGDAFGEVVEASDGRELMWALLRNEFATDESEHPVVITDLSMPGYDGLDVIEAWHELAPRGLTILITAYPSEAVRARARAAGAVMLAKPFRTSALRDAIRELVPGGVSVPS